MRELYFSMNMKEKLPLSKTSSKKGKLVDIIKLLTSPQNIAQFTFIMQEWSQALAAFLLIYKNKELIMTNEIVIERLKDREICIINSKYMDYYVIEVIIPLMYSLFKPEILRRLYLRSGKMKDEIEESEEIVKDEEIEISVESENEISHPDVAHIAASRFNEGPENLELFSLIQSWILQICTISKNHLIIANQTKRGTLSS